MAEILTVRNLCKNYPAFELHDVSFSIRASSIMGLTPQSIDISRVSAIHKPRRCHAGATHQPNKAMGRRN